MRAFRKYILFVAAAIGGGIALVAVFNAVVDPFGLFRIVDRAGFNHVKPVEGEHRRLIKAWRIRAVEPRGLIFGSSRAEAALSPAHPGWPADAQPVYNASFPDANPYEMFRYFQHAAALAPVREVVIGLDFFSFNVDFGNRPDFDEKRLAVRADGGYMRPPVDEAVALLLSADAVAKSLTTLRRQQGDTLLQLDGQQTKPEGMPADFHGYHGLFLFTENDYVTFKWRPAPRHEFRLRDPATGYARFDDLRNLLAWARARGTNVRLFVSPDHAALMEARRQAGLWPTYEDWQRDLVRTVEEEAAEAHAPPFALWDFADYNEATTEAIPPWDDLETAMTWFRDPSHYARPTGTAILDTIFVVTNDAAARPDHFGVPLNSSNLEAHLASVREQQARYARTHPDVVAEIADVVSADPNTETARRIQQLFHRHP